MTTELKKTKRTRAKASKKYGFSHTAKKPEKPDRFALKTKRGKRIRSLKRRIRKVKTKRKQEREEKKEHRLASPIRRNNTKRKLRRMDRFIKEMNSTNNKKEILLKYKNIISFFKFLYDDKLEIPFKSDEYLEFEKNGKFKKTKVSYNNLREILQDLDDYKKEKALLHFHNFIIKFPKYKQLILDILDRKQIVKPGEVEEKEIEEEKFDENNMVQLFEEIETMVKNLNETNSKRDKLTKLFNYPHLRKILIYVYSPNITYGINTEYYLKYENNDKKKKILTKIPYTNIYKLLKDLSERKITGQEANKFLYNFIQEYLPYKQTILNILEKTLKIRISVKGINKVFNNLIPEFEVPLARLLDEKIIKESKEDWYMSRKVDGVRCIIIIRKINNKKNIRFFSRTGKEFFSLNMIRDPLLKNFREFDVKNGTVLDGEIIVNGKNGQERLNLVMEKILKHNYQMTKAEYRVFDMMSLATFLGKEKGELFHRRFLNYGQIFQKGRIDKNIRGLMQHKYTDKKYKKFMTKSKENKWEGIIFRKNTFYKKGRSKDILKYKKIFDGEYKVKDVESTIIRVIVDGVEEEEEVMGKIILEYKNQKVGSGFSLAERRKYHQNPELIIGKIVTINYIKETENSLIHTSFKGIHGEKRVM